jgi:hypothetical protein
VQNPTAFNLSMILLKPDYSRFVKAVHSTDFNPSIVVSNSEDKINLLPAGNYVLMVDVRYSKNALSDSKKISLLVTS